MAKRRRLEAPTAPLETKSQGRAAPPPIAQVAGEASTLAAAQNLMGEVERARAEGRLVISIPLEDILVDHLVRDRLFANDEEMDALKSSISTHGQRIPIEVVQTDAGYGLISGWRRLAALSALYKTGSDPRFAKIKALIRTPQDAGDAYVAMIEENEIRVGLSYYERARIAVLAAERGAFASAEDAVDVLYASGSRAKRSKIRSFMAVHDALGEALQFPAAIPERLGLKIAAALKEGQINALQKALSHSAQTPEVEAANLVRALQKPAPDKVASKQKKRDISVQVSGSGASRRMVLEGAGVTDALVSDIRKLMKKL